MGLGDGRSARLGRHGDAHRELAEGVLQQPRVGFFQQRSNYQDAIDAGKVLPPAKSMDDMHTVVTNSTVDGVISAVLALLIVVVILDAARICVRHIRDPLASRLGEAPYVESRTTAPAGLFATREEKEEEKQAAQRQEPAARP
ncbi:hypothetical protein SALBM135S_04355 [Streptomyces alboniger]